MRVPYKRCSCVQIVYYGTYSIPIDICQTIKIYHNYYILIESVESIEKLKFVGDNFDELAECGFTKPSTKLLLTDETDIQTISLHHMILKTLGELSQFRDGLETLGVGKAMEENGQLLWEFFCHQGSRLDCRFVLMSVVYVHHTWECDNRGVSIALGHA